MRNSTFGKVVGVLVGAVIIGALIGWWVSRNPGGEVSVTTQEPVTRTAAAPDPERVPSPSAPVIAPAPKPVPPVASTNFVAEDWEEKLDEILASDTDTNKKADDLLNMMPKVNEEAQIELAGHIVNLVDDKHYARVVPYLTNPAVSEEVSSVFMNDLYNRADSLKLPIVLDVARTPNHPLAEEARDLLELYIEEDYGTDWGKWESAVNQWLKDNPDEEK